MQRIVAARLTHPNRPSPSLTPRLARWGATVAAMAVLAGCTSGEDSEPEAASAGPAASETATSQATPPPVRDGVEHRTTERLDAIAVIGHSGATGTPSDPDDPTRDARENSWATGQSPQVRSIYRRLLADHPDLRGHHYNYAVNGATVDDLSLQLDALLESEELLPDVLLVQGIDNDMRCDGTDRANYGPFASALRGVLSRAAREIPRVQIFLVSQWATVEAWTRWARHHEEQMRVNQGVGPCLVFDRRGRPRPAGIRSMQHIVDSYWAATVRVCAEIPRCFTDRGALRDAFVPTDRDLGPDLNHLSVAGHRKFAAIAWQALPPAILDHE